MTLTYDGVYRHIFARKSNEQMQVVEPNQEALLLSLEKEISSKELQLEKACWLNNDSEAGNEIVRISLEVNIVSL